MTTANNATGAAGAGGSAAAGATQAGGEGQKATPAPFDQTEFNRNLQETLTQRDQQLTTTILSAVSKMQEGQTRAIADANKPPIEQEIMNEVSEEVEAMGLNENGAKALLSFTQKLINKKAPEIKQETKNEVHGELSHEDQKKAYNNEILARFPQAMDESSRLRQQARLEYQAMDPALLKSPRATSIAIETAARKLGIQALSIEQINARDAQTESGSGSGNKKLETGPTQEQVDFAMGFQVKEEAFKKHLSKIQKRDQGLNS